MKACIDPVDGSHDIISDRNLRRVIPTTENWGRSEGRRLSGMNTAGGPRSNT